MHLRDTYRLLAAEVSQKNYPLLLYFSNPRRQYPRYHHKEVKGKLYVLDPVDGSGKFRRVYLSLDCFKIQLTQQLGHL